MELIEETKKGNKILKIYRDEHIENPRDWDNLSKFVLNHKRYNLPNELNINFDNFDNWKDVKECLKKDFNAVLIYVVNGYEHSGFYISLSSEYPFNDYWDSGVLGFICVIKDDLIKEYGKDTKETRKKAEKVLKNEFEIYKNYIEGDVFGFEIYKSVKVKVIKEYSKTKKEIYKTTEQQLIDSCWGYFGDEGIKRIKQENNF